MSAGTAIPILDALPAGVTYGSVTAVSGLASATCNSAATPLSCTATLAGQLAVNGQAVLDIVATAPTTAGTITNYASVSPDGTAQPPTPGPNCASGSCVQYSSTVRTPILSLAKSGPSNVVAGS